MPAVARRLAFLGDGHNKFLESIVVWLDVVAPRYFWQEFDTYRVGVTRQSESTMHTVTQRPLAQTDFSHSVPEAHLAHLNRLISEGRWEETKWQLPESFLQRRVVSANYMALQRIVRQRLSHRLPEWREFVDQLIASVEHPEYLKES
jgi:thymidylate synthase ThyX